MSRLNKYAFALCGLLLAGADHAQTTGTNLNFDVKSTFEPTIKDAIKLSDVPEIRDSVKRIGNITYPITSRPVFPKYEVQPIQPAKIQNEPLQKLYKSLLKAGYSPFYNMPYGEFWIANTRSRENSFGGHLRHLSSTTHLESRGYGGFSENEASIFGKQFYTKHTLAGEFNYSRNVIHYYGYDTAGIGSDLRNTKQRYELFEPKLHVLSHYTDSNHINHNSRLSYYNLRNLDRETENNIRLSTRAGMFINKEKFNLGFLTDYYNHRQRNDTLNDLIITLNPSFEAHGKKWHVDLGVAGTLDNFRSKSSFYFYPQLNVDYDIYEQLIIPYAGVTGGLQKNSFRSLSTENPFVDTTIKYRNTDNKYNLFGGLRGNLSSRMSYDVRTTFSRLDSLYFFVNDYSTPLANQFAVVYDNATLLNISGQLKYQMREKLNVIAKGGYYLYSTKRLERPIHKPEFDMTFSAIYNLASKIIVRADIYIMGNQWSLVPAGTPVLKPKVISGWGDINLETEYRYSRMMSFFARFNNIAGQRYYRWDRYPSQKFSFMIGLSFVPF